MVSTITSLNSTVRHALRDRRGRLKAMLPAFLVCLSFFGLQAQTAPTYTVCPGFPGLILPAGDGGLTLNSANIPSLLGVTAVDPDGAETITYSASPSAITCADIGPGFSIAVTATDSDGSDVCNITVDIFDGGPFANCNDITINLDGAGTHTLDAANEMALSMGSSACTGISDVSVSPDMFDCTDIGTPVQVTVTVEDGNTATAFCLANVTVLDMAPSASCVAPFNLPLDGTGNASITTGDIDNGSTVGSCGMLGLSLDVSSFDCSDVGANTVTLTVDDGNGQSTTCSTTVTVQDNDTPTAACNDITVELDATGNYTLTAANLTALSSGSTDNCTLTTSSSVSAFDCSDIGANTVTITVSDGTNSDDCSADITVEDNIDPTQGTCPMDISMSNDAGNCSAVVTYTAPTFDDNCGGTGQSGTLTAGMASGATFPVGTTTVTYSFTDVGGNMATCSFDVTITDDEDPMITCPMDFSINNAGNNCFNTATWTVPVVTDNCGSVTFVSATAEDYKGNAIAITDAMGSPSAVLPIDTSTIEYTFMDGNGNSLSCSFEVVVLDTEGPIILCPAAQTQDISSCNAASEFVPDFRSLGSYTDNCTGYEIVQSPAPGTLLSTLSTPADGETYMVTITVTDLSPNNLSDNCSFMVTLVENDEPQPSTVGAVLPMINTDCGPITIDAPAAIDACGNLVCGEPFPPGIATLVNNNCGAPSGPCNPEARQSSTGSVSLPDNNPGGVNSTITVAGLNPLIEDVDLNLEITHTWVGDLRATLTSPNGTTIELFNRPGVPAGTFGCAGNDLEVTFDDDAANTAADFETTCGNLPAISGDFQAIVPLAAFVGENPNGDWVLNVSDNAGGDNGAVTEWSLDICTQVASMDVNSYLFPVGTHTITWIYDDGNGNSSSQLQQIVVADDVVAPDFDCQDIVVELDATGNASINNDDVFAFAEVAITGGDDQSNVAGNTDLTFTTTAAQTFTFDWLYTSNDIPGFDGFGYVVNGTFVLLSSTNGESGTNAVNLNPGDVFAFRTATADNIDANGTGTVSNFSPGFSGDFSLVNWTFSNTNANGTIDVLDGEATDNCTATANLNISLSQTMFDCSDLGANTITMTVMDANNNSASCMPTVTVVDLIEPTITGVPMNVTVDCNSIPTAPAINTPGGVNASDNCDTPVLVMNESTTQTGNDNNCGNYNYTITRTWTATDNSNNSGAVSQVITVEDTDAPTNPMFNGSAPSGIISVDAAGCTASISLALLDLDDCAPYTAITISNNSPHAFTNGANASGDYPVGTHTVTFTATDPCGNTDDWDVSFTVADQVAPIASCQNGLTLGLPSSGTLTITPALVNNNSIDNCSAPGDLTLSISPSTFDCDNADGTTQWPVTLTVTDEANNASSCNTFVVIQDNNDPTALCVGNITVTLDATGAASITPADIDNGSSDDCDPTLFSYMLSDSSFDLNDLSSNTLTTTLTVADSSGNTDACMTNVDVQLAETCFDVGTTAGAAGTTVSVPVFVDNFINVQSLQFVAVIADNSAAEFTGVSSINLPGMSFTANLDGNNGDTISISWFNDQIPPVPVTLPNNSMIFNFEVLLTGTVGDFSLIAIANGASQNIEVIHDYNGTFFNLTPCLEVGAVAINNPAMLEVAGTVFTEDSNRVALVDITLENTSTNTVFGTMTTMNDGEYSFSPVSAGNNYEITPVKDINWTNGVTAFDLFVIQSHIVGIDTLDSEYKKIAANAFPDTKITTFDVVRLHQLLASLGTVTPAGNTSWRFVPADAVLTSANIDDVPASSQTITLNGLNQDSLSNDFIAIKVGNVVGNVDTTMFNGGGADTRSAKTLNFDLKDQAIVAGETYQLDFLASDFSNIVAYQWILNFDPSVAEFVATTAGSLQNFSDFNVGTDFAQDGRLVMLWYDAKAAQLNDDEVVFSLTFKALKDAPSIQSLYSVGGDELVTGAYQKDGLAMDVNLNFEKGTESTKGFSLYQNNPNPFLGETMISFSLPEATTATITISDITGRVLKVIDGDFTQGYNEITINRSELPNHGVLYYQLDTPTDSATRKMIAVE